eukprot:TRINITY_DN1208_c0_g1_i2.p3 TRINITY_DN1208_c0_g1~~TRINITY_DN1208_c0_g1_i2.p3  ORF type:complete len:288 (+),score=148.80 TRINITY_DN1208_c0_g1_i2:1175-2038(+)
MNKHPTHKIAIPENSLNSMQFGIDHGTDGIEFDLVMTKDGEILAFHDPTLTRMCRVLSDDELAQIKAQDKDSKQAAASDLASVDPDSEIVALTLKQIKEKVVYRNDVDPDQRIPTFEQILKKFQTKPLANGKRCKMMVEVKTDTGDLTALAEGVVKQFEMYDLYDVAVVGCFHPVLLYLVRKMQPKIVTLLLICRNLVKDKKSLIAYAYNELIYYSNMTWMASFLGAGVVGFDRALVFDSKTFDIKAWQDAGYVLNCWTVNKPEEFEILRQHKVSVTTDFIFPISHF